MDAEPTLVVRDLSKRYGATTAVDGVSFSVPRGSFLTLLGPSGSGKTTVLRLIGGLEAPDAGYIGLAGSDVGRLPPYRRDIGIVFQNYALFPHMTVAENVGFPLKQRGVRKAERKARIDNALQMVGLHARSGEYPATLSGGQQQRVALARALVFEPRILLMDEPLSALDKGLRERLQEEIRVLQQRLEITTLYVTHDQSEAFVMSDTIAVMNHGRIEQIGSPRELYEKPATEFVASFVGDSNIFRGTLLRGDADVAVLQLPDGSEIRCPGSPMATADVAALVRPERIEIESAAATAPVTHNVLHGTVTSARYVAGVLDYRVSAGSFNVIVHQTSRSGEVPFIPGTAVTLSWPITETLVL